MRKAFLTIASGTTTATSPPFAQGDRRKKCPATRLVMKSERADRMPLHSSATWIVKFDKLNTNPCRKTGTPRSENRMSVASAELRCRNPMMASKRKEGSGTIKRRKSSPNETLRPSVIPKQDTKIPQQITTHAKIIIDNWSGAKIAASADQEHQAPIPITSDPSHGLHSLETKIAFRSRKRTY